MIQGYFPINYGFWYYPLWYFGLPIIEAVLRVRGRPGDLRIREISTRVVTTFEN